MLYRPEMKTLFSILLLAAASIYCAVGNERDFNPAELPCSKVGFFPVAGSCQDYYECRVWEDRLVPFYARCPPERIFDDVAASCLPKSYVTSPAHCLSDAAAPGLAVADAAAPRVAVVDAAALGVTVVDGSITDDTASGVVDVNEEEDVSGNPTSPVTAKTLPGNVTAEVEEDPAVPAGGSAMEIGTGVLEDSIGFAYGGDITVSNGTIVADDTETIVPAEEMTICDHMRIVDTYATLVISNPSLEESFEYQKKYNKNVMKYNRHLEKAQNNSLIWRNGESILTGIKRTYAQASAYEAEFNKKYEIYQDRMKTVSKQNNNYNEIFIQKLNDDIKKLQEDINGNEQILSITDVPQLRIYFENNIISKRQEIERKQQEIKGNTKAGLQLGELKQFLEYVKHDANEVEILARHSKNRMEMLREDLEVDYVSFEKYATVVKEDIRALKEEEEHCKKLLTENEARQLSLENQKDDMAAEIDVYNEDNEKNRNTIYKLRGEMESKIKKFYSQKYSLCRKNVTFTLYINANASEIERAQACNATLEENNVTLDFSEERVTKSQKDKLCCSENGTITSCINANASPWERVQACNDILEENNVTLDLSEERVRIQDLTEKNRRNLDQITAILSNMTVMDQLMRALLSVVHTYPSRIREIDFELQRLQMYSSDLENLQHGISSTMDSLLNIMKEFQEMQSSFESITKQFNIMIAQAENDNARQHEILAIEQDISYVPGQLEQLMLPELGKCT